MAFHSFALQMSLNTLENSMQVQWRALIRRNMYLKQLFDWLQKLKPSIVIQHSNKAKHPPGPFFSCQNFKPLVGSSFICLTESSLNFTGFRVSASIRLQYYETSTRKIFAISNIPIRDEETFQINLLFSLFLLCQYNPSDLFEK